MKTYGETIKFQDIMWLCTRYDEFSDHDKLWSSTGNNKFIDPPNFGKKTGIHRDQSL